MPQSQPSQRCPECGAEFTDASLLTLHRGENHYEELDDEERQEYAEAYEDESDELRRFRLK
ncbi:MAG: C2H2-type zinc finger protein, partial [Halobacteria archaeon]|nr:C2H2-type zinc finger protein [Halobacteria archaeon]